MMNEQPQSALAAAGFELPPDPEERMHRQTALSHAIALTNNRHEMNASASAVVECAEAFFNFLNGKTAAPKE